MSERFTAMMPVLDFMADDPALLAEAEQQFRLEWPLSVREAGGEPVGEPEVSHRPNPGYGRVLTDDQGQPVLREDGEQVVDRVKLVIFGTGWANR